MEQSYENLISIRKLLKISQADMAKHLECTKSTYCRVENGKIKCSLDSAKKITEVINKALVSLNLAPITMETIFFTKKVPKVEQED